MAERAVYFSLQKRKTRVRDTIYNFNHSKGCCMKKEIIHATQTASKDRTSTIQETETNYHSRYGRTL